MVQSELDRIQARLDTKNQNQKNYMERKKLLEEEKGGSEKVQLVKTKKEQNRISQEKRMAQQGKMRLVEVEEKGMKGLYLIDPVPHYLLIQLLIHWLHHKQI